MKLVKDSFYPVYWPDQDYGDEYDVSEELFQQYEEALNQFVKLRDEVRDCLYNSKKKKNDN